VPLVGFCRETPRGPNPWFHVFPPRPKVGVSRLKTSYVSLKKTLLHAHIHTHLQSHTLQAHIHTCTTRKSLTCHVYCNVLLLLGGNNFHNKFRGGGGGFGEGGGGGEGRGRGRKRRSSANFAPFNRLRLMVITCAWAISVYLVGVWRSAASCLLHLN